MKVDLKGWYEKYGAMVLRRCRWILRDEEEAADAMQEVFVQVLRRADRLSGQYPSSLLYTIATNHCLNLIRAKKRRGIRVSLPEDLPAIDPSSGALEAKSVLEAVFRDEDESTRTMAWLHFVDGLTFDDVSRETGLSPSGVRKRLEGLKERAVRLKKPADSTPRSES